MRLLILLAVVFSLCACRPEQKATRVDYHFIPFYFGKIYLERLPVNDEGFEVLDSAEITYKTEHLIFTIPEQEESVFQLRIAGKPLKIYLINDVDHIVIQASSTNPKDYAFQNGGANPVLKSFLDKQKKIADAFTPLAVLARDTTSPEARQELMRQVDSLRDVFEQNARTFADTTTSAGAFLFAYNSVEFGEDRENLEPFITRAGKRFPHHRNIQILVKETLDYINIFEEEFDIGEHLPPLSLARAHGIEVPVLPAMAKYTFIDMWSTWCAPCLAYMPVKKEAAKKFPADKLAFVSIAIDAEKETWKQVVEQQQIPGTHFIDEKMWRGKAAKTWKFDSIPFNYLIGPDGRILAKAISPDSLMPVLTKFVQ